MTDHTVCPHNAVLWVVLSLLGTFAYDGDPFPLNLIAKAKGVQIMSTHNKPVGPSGKNPTPGNGGFDGASTPKENLDKIKNKDALQDVPQGNTQPSAPITPTK